MKIQVETVSPVEKKVLVEVDPERVAAELGRAYTQLGRRVKLKGFRPGKTPRRVLERNFRVEVEAEVLERLVAETFGEAAREHAIDAVAPPRVQVAEPGLGEGRALTYTARVEVRPRLEPKDYRGLEATRRAVDVTDDQVAEELSRLQDSLAQLVPVEGRFEAREGDFAVVDHEGTVGGAPFPGSKAEGVTVQVREGDFFRGFVPGLAGKKLGEALEIEQAFPADHPAAELAGRVARFRLTLRSFKTRQIPSLDDELARDLGIEGVDSLAKLRSRIRSDLEAREKRRAEAELRDALVKAALDRNDFEVPPAMVERAIDAMIEGTAQRFARQGIDVRRLDLDVARLRGELREAALGQVKAALLLQAIADAEKIEVSDEDVRREIARMAEEARLPLATVQAQLRSPEARAALGSRLREEKALAFLASAANLK